MKGQVSGVGPETRNQKPEVKLSVGDFFFCLIKKIRIGYIR
jgi:hypothetical protein